MLGNRSSVRRQKVRALAMTILSSAPGAQSVLAQEQTMMLEEVLVTATRRASDIQTTALSIAAVDGQRIDALGATNLFEAANYLPGVTITGTAGYNNFPIGIRGIASSTSLVGSDDPVAVYVDGVYIGKPSAVMSEMLGLERVEVLRGPQGALYGRNATAGAILLVHELPSDTPEASINLRYGNYNRWRTRFGASGPLALDGVSAGIDLSFTDEDGWGDNLLTGGEANAREASAALGTFAYEGDVLSVAMRVDGMDEEVSQGFQRLNALPFNQADPSQADNSLQGDPDDYMTNFPAVFDRSGGGVNLTIDLEPGSFGIHSVTGYRLDDLEGSLDSDGSATDFSRNETDERHDQFFQSLFLTRATDHSDLIAGVDIYLAQTRLQQKVSLVSFASSLNIFADNESRAASVFAEYSRDISEALRLTLGGRYSYEEKRFEDRSEGEGLLADIPNRVQENDWDSFTPVARLSFDATEDVMLYGSVSTGFKSGGFTVQQAGSFNPEDVITYETGIKSSWDNGRITANGALFYSDYDDLQVRVPVSFGVIQTRNAGEAEILGVEMDASLALGDVFRLSASMTYLDTEYVDFLGPGDIQNQGERLNRAPEWEGSVTLDFTKTLDLGIVSGELTYAYRDEVFFQAPNLEALGSPAYDQLDARLALTAASGRWSLSLVGRNLLDERYVANVVVLGSGLIATYNDPPRYFVEAEYRF
ncbi:TonB-dependent receptor [Pseudohaliea sp.]|uniref:TonB-dependent receptor n=1 Tax=Pseudohaliea sp. TaxID=2740289 RepID=UPI0032EE7D71